MRAFDVVVVGAGAIGAATALEAARRGARVALLERQGAGEGTSSRGAGIVCHLAWHPLDVRLVARSARALHDLSQTAASRGYPFKFQVTGSTTLARQTDADVLTRFARMQREAGVRVDVLSPEDCAALPGHARLRMDDVGVAVHCPDDGWASPKMFSRFAADLAQEAGVARVEGANAVALDVAGGRVRGVRLQDGKVVRAERVVVATGVWSRRLLAGARLSLPIRAYRTQATVLAAPDAEALPIVHDTVQGCYMRPDEPGQLLVGNGTTTTPEDPDAFKREADPDFVRRSQERVAHRILGAPRPPLLRRAWAGVDAGTPDRHPLLGEDPRVEGLVLAVGGNGFGFMRAPALGEAAACLALGKTPPVDVSLYAPARFAGREGADFEVRGGFTLDAADAP